MSAYVGKELSFFLSSKVKSRVEVAFRHVHCTMYIYEYDILNDIAKHVEIEKVKERERVGNVAL